MENNRKHSKFNVIKNAANRNIVRLIFMAVFALNGATLLGQQQASVVTPSTLVPSSAPTESGGAAPKPAPVTNSPHKIGPLDVTVNWRFRTEAWDSFAPSKGQNAYAFDHSLLRIGIGQKTEAFEWLLEGAADAMFDLPPSAVQAAPLGQLGLGGTYFAANGNVRNTAGGFLKQAYVGFKF